MWHSLHGQLKQRWLLWTLFFVNFLGSIYGFYWYKNQLIDVGSWLNIFVPDSPTASTAFTLVLLFFIWNRHVPLLEAFAAVTLFKYGIWAVVMIVAGAAQEAYIHGGIMVNYMVWSDWMLIGSHSGMAAQALLYGRFYTYRLKHLFVVAAWTLLNDTVDYTLNLHPWLRPSLNDYIPIIGWYTVTLSFLSLAVAAWLVYRPANS